MGKLTLDKLTFGEIDAKHEFLNETKEERTLFTNCFYKPDNYKDEDFITGKKFYITGLKGTGKTALLHYLGINAEDKGYLTKFVLYKSQIDEDQRKKIVTAGRVEILDADENKNTISDYRSVWKWFIYNQIAELNTNNGFCLFSNDKNWDCFAKLLVADFDKKKEKGIWRLIPKIKKGNIEITSEFSNFAAKAGLELEWDNEKKHITVFSLVRNLDYYFDRLICGKGKALVLFDELELSLPASNQYEKDCKLINDLVFSIEDINTKCMKRKYGVKCIAAIRSEVARQVFTIGNELNKVLGLSVEISWNHYTRDIYDHPLLKLIEKKIEGSEKKYGIYTENIWNEYFPQLVNNWLIKDYILHQTWYRPRDIVRLLKFAKEKRPNDKQFTQLAFDSCRKEYSTGCWIELCEELSAKYSTSDIQGIQDLLMGIKIPFDKTVLNTVILNKTNDYNSVDKLFQNKKTGDLLTDLYRIGIIGNSDNGKIRFSFRGDDNLLIEKDMIIHEALKNFFSIM